MNEETINDRFKALRSALGLTQTAFGESIGLSRSEVKNIEYGKTTLKEIKIPIICREHKVNESWLRTGKGDMFRLDADENALMEWAGSVLGGEDDDFRRRFLKMLSRLNREQWAAIEAMANMLAESETKDQRG